MRYYCTYFDSYYLLRGLTLYKSLQKHAEPFVLWVLCCDEASAKTIETLAQDDLRPVRMHEVEEYQPLLLEAKANRNHVEYLWTFSPIWPQFLFDREPEIDLLTYLDADLFFYDSPEPIFEEMGDNSIAMFGHRFPEKSKYMECNGIYNVGWMSFRRDVAAFRCLDVWREQCLEWCYDRTEPGRYGDQKYLDSWPDDFPGTRVLEHEGSAIAPWNWTLYDFDKSGDSVTSNGVPLIFFHFHGLRFLNSWLYDAFYSGYLHGEMPPRIRDWIFTPYIDTMIEAAKWARERGCQVDFGHFPFKKYMDSYGKRLLIRKLLKRQFVFHRGLK